MSELTFEEIQSFISEFCVIEKEKLTPEAKLYHDLYITGDDAIEFMEAFIDKYDIDITGFCFTKYFREEGQSIVDLYYFFSRGKN
jgi:acyl carrier protein